VPVPVRARARVLVQNPLPTQAQLQLWGVVDLVERVPKSGGHHPERAVVGETISL
jgi:hypothetical protein